MRHEMRLDVMLAGEDTRENDTGVAIEAMCDRLLCDLGVADVVRLAVTLEVGHIRPLEPVAIRLDGQWVPVRLGPLVSGCAGEDVRVRIADALVAARRRFAASAARALWEQRPSTHPFDERVATLAGELADRGVNVAKGLDDFDDSLTRADTEGTVDTIAQPQLSDRINIHLGPELWAMACKRAEVDLSGDALGALAGTVADYRETLRESIGHDLLPVGFVLDTKLGDWESCVAANHVRLTAWLGPTSNEIFALEAPERLRTLGIEARHALSPPTITAGSVLRIAPQTARLSALGYRQFDSVDFALLASMRYVTENATTMLSNSRVAALLQILCDEQDAAILVGVAIERLGIPRIAAALRELMRSRISVSDLRAIVDAAVRPLPKLASDDVERIRHHLRRTISSTASGDAFPVYVLEPDLESWIREQEPSLDVEQRVVAAVGALHHPTGYQELPAAVLVSSDIRSRVSEALSVALPQIKVFGSNEFTLDADPVVIGAIALMS